MVVGNSVEDLVRLDAILPLLLPAHVSTCRSSTRGAGWELWVEVGSGMDGEKTMGRVGLARCGRKEKTREELVNGVSLDVRLQRST
jgi:hypothetical protein